MANAPLFMILPRLAKFLKTLPFVQSLRRFEDEEDGVKTFYTKEIVNTWQQEAAGLKKIRFICASAMSTDVKPGFIRTSTTSFEAVNARAMEARRQWGHQPPQMVTMSPTTLSRSKAFRTGEAFECDLSFKQRQGVESQNCFQLIK